MFSVLLLLDLADLIVKFVGAIWTAMMLLNLSLSTMFK